MKTLININKLTDGLKFRNKSRSMDFKIENVTIDTFKNAWGRNVARVDFIYLFNGKKGTYINDFDLDKLPINPSHIDLLSLSINKIIEYENRNKPT